LPDLTLPEEPKEKRTNGIYGERHCKFLKEHRKVMYWDLLTQGKLYSYLCDVDEQARNRLEHITKQMAEKEGINEQLKSENQMEWIGKMTNIRNRAMEIVNHEIIYA
jgi:hypothetical protein